MDNKNKCPYCGAELQENAQYCLYCMRPLNEKKDVTPTLKMRGKKIALMITIVVCALLAVVPVVLTILRRSNNGNEGEPSSDAKASDVSDVTDPYENFEPAPDEEWPIITTFEDFAFRIVQKNHFINPTHLWDSDGFDKIGTVVDGDGDDWDVYTTEVYKKGIDVKVYFCESGKEIMIAVTGLTDDTYQDGLSLTDCLSASVYEPRVSYVSHILSNGTKFPMVEVPEEEDWMTHVGFQSLEDEGLPDGAQINIRKTMVGFTDDQDMADQVMGVEVRKRVYQSETFYDMIIWHTQLIEKSTQ